MIRLRKSGMAKMLRIVSSTYAISWTVPPAASICLRADSENLCATTVSFLVRLPVPRILSPSLCPLTRPAWRSAPSSTVAPLSKRSRSARFTTAKSFLKMFVKPRFGRRRWSGIWPPSKPRMREKPERDFCPFSPRAAVLPWPEPGPRPTRFLACFAPFFGFSLLSSMIDLVLLHDFHEMRDLFDHAAHLFGVHPLGHAVHLAQPERLERLAHLDGAADAGADLADADRLLLRAFAALLLGRAHSAASGALFSALPRRVLYSSSLRSCLRASKVALTTLWGLAVPRDLVRMFWMPADSRMARTGPPAMTPVPSEAGLRRARPAP